MGHEQPACYYDAIYNKSEEYKKNWRNSRYLKVWERMAQRLDPEILTVDLGCGPGQAAAMLYHQFNFKRYKGLDFSGQSIKMAQELSLPATYSFKQGDIFTEVYGAMALCNPPAMIQFFCSETLEHIEKDTELLELLCQKAPGASIAISVPTFDDPGHVRHFKTPQAALDRYNPYLTNIYPSTIGPWIVLVGKLLSNKQAHKELQDLISKSS